MITEAFFKEGVCIAKIKLFKVICRILYNCPVHYFWVQIFCSEQFTLELQVQPYSVIGIELEMFLLCDEMMVVRLRMQLQLTFTVFLSKILLKLLPLGICISINL